LIGGNDYVDNVDALFVDNAENIYLTGMTLSSDFPFTEGTLTGSFGITGGYIMKLSKNLERVIFATPIQAQLGLHNDQFFTQDSVENLIVGASTNVDTFFTTPGVYQPSQLPPVQSNPTNWDLTISKFWIPDL